MAPVALVLEQLWRAILRPIDPGLFAEANSPYTSQERLAWLAEHYPELRANIAANPNVHPELLNWIRAQNGNATFAAQPQANPRKKKPWFVLAIVGAAVLVVGALVAAVAHFALGRTTPDTPPNAVTDSQDSSGETASGSESQVWDLLINQVDSSEFPYVTVYFMALALDGTPVTTLERSQVSASEGGSAPLAMTEFLVPGDDRTLTISLVLDSSGSMAGQPMEEARDSATRFLDYVDLEGGDLIEVSHFNDESYVQLPYSADRVLLDAAIGTIEASGGTALLDAAYNALIRAYAQPGQKAIILYTDGYEMDSVVTMDEVTSLSMRLQIPIYVVGVGTDVDEGMLRALATQTGGRYYFSPTAGDLAEIYEDVYDDERQMYAATFTSASTASAGSIDLTLSVQAPEYSGSTQTAYEPSAEEDLPLELLYSGVSASSTLAPQNAGDIDQIMEYIPFHAFDGRNDTTWAEGAPGDGVGEWIQVDFARPTTVSGFEINNGYWRLPERIHQNGRVKTMRVTFSDGSEEVVDLFDTGEAQWIDYYINNGWDPEELPVGEVVEFSTPHSTRSMRFTVESVYPGDTWDDLCITGITPFR